MPNTIYPLKSLRTLALAAQGLHRAQIAGAVPDLHSINQLVRKIGLLQIDTLQVVHRAHYLTLWSRLGYYRPADLDRLAYDPQQRSLFEYWGHAVTYIPLEHYRYYLPAMQTNANDRWVLKWLEKSENLTTLHTVRRRVMEEGAVRASQFENPGKSSGVWWNWKPAKLALEHLYNSGELMIASRVNFQRVYDLRERVLPSWVDTRPPDPQESLRHFVRLGAQGLGVFRPEQLADYTYSKRTLCKPIVQELIRQGELVELQGEIAQGGTATWLIRAIDLPLLQQAADGALRAERTVFLNHFDNLFWAKDRDEQLWDFEQAMEAYTPAPKRRWGYFCLPILHQDRLVGRFDPRLDRKAKRLRILALHLEKGVQADEEMVQATAAAMREFLKFHHASDIVFESSHSNDFGKKLAAAM
jgi:hypothetical protein